MGFSSAVAVNSSFTKGVVDKTWPDLKKRVETRVVYPCVDTQVNDDAGQDGETLFKDEKIILSINRFERKKNIDLAIKAFAAIPESERKGVRLILAGRCQTPPSILSKRLPLPILTSPRRSRSSRLRKRRIPLRTRISRLLPQPRPPNHQEPHLGPLGPLPVLRPRPLPPLHPKYPQGHPPTLRPRPALHPDQRTLWHCPSRSHASWHSRTGRRLWRSGRDHRRRPDRLATQSRRHPSLDRGRAQSTQYARQRTRGYG